jgi:hypothetical protein
VGSGAPALPALKLAVIADHSVAQRFALDSLDSIEGCTEYALFSCTNSRPGKRRLKHAAYYALNLVTVRNHLTRLVPLAQGRKRIARTVTFEAEQEGAWQRLPKAVVRELAGFDIVLKLGMGLLRVPPEEEMPAPILSFHHGDPDRYRGRPAGFWEIANGEPVVGQIVQAIGNSLDAGHVAAFAETKVHPWSYKATLVEAYRHSPLIINEAIRNALARRWIAKPCTGRNWRLPGNATVLAFVLKTAARAVRRLAYGAVMEKKWQVSLAPVAPADVPATVEGHSFPPPAAWETLKVGCDYLFYADPFFSTDPPGILLEALRRGSGLGEIVLAGPQGHRRISSLAGHASYPATVSLRGRQLIVPEIASVSAPRLFAIQEGVMRELGPLAMESEERVSDPTLIEHEGRLYLFGNIPRHGSSALFLWLAEGIKGPFRLHPQSPVRISPRGGRMAGNLLRDGDRLIRFGQNLEGGYGDGILAFEVEELSPERYCEKPLGVIRFTDRHGPHTLNFDGGRIVFDWYVERFAPLAGVRRLLARLRARRLARGASEARPAPDPGPRG